MSTSVKPNAQAKKEQTVAQAIANVDSKKKAMMPDLKVSKGGSPSRGEVIFLPSELGKVGHSPQTAMTIYGYFHLCNERGLTAGEAWISKQDINDIVIVSDRPHPTKVDKTSYTWKNWQTGEILEDAYIQDTFPQYTANAKRYKVMAKQR
tara:strand:+ start:128 stop:577 length:450 start_codon:yes stop_codon:yes gene_type:complete